MGGLKLRCLAWGGAAALIVSGCFAVDAGALAVGVTVPGVGDVEATVTTPTVTAPALPPPPTPTSPVPAPALPVPTVPTPTLASPTLPAPTAPSAVLPVAPVVTDAVSAPVDATAPAPSGGSAGGGGSPAAGVGAPGVRTGASGAGAAAPRDPGDAPGPTSRPLSGSSGAAFSAPRSTAGVTQTVTVLRQCLDELSASQRRVLSLRAGLGAGAPLTRSQVARRLDLGVARTGRIERRGLRRLDRLAGAGACGGAAGGANARPAGAHGAAVAILTAGAATGLRPRFGVGGVVAHGGADDAANDSGGGDSVLGLPPPIGTGGEATLLVALGLLLVLGLLVRRELLRR